jgi:hypothetical protein
MLWRASALAALSRWRFSFMAPRNSPFTARSTSAIALVSSPESRCRRCPRMTFALRSHLAPEASDPVPISMVLIHIDHIILK